MYFDCFCCYKKYRCIFMCCSCSCFHIIPMKTKKNKNKVKRVDWNKVYIREYNIYLKKTNSHP